MKTVKIFGPTLIKGAVRYPIEGDLRLADAEADRIVENGQGEIIEADAVEEAGDDIGKLKVDELRALADREGIALGEVKAKAEIIGLIQQHRAGGAGANGE